MQTSLHSSLPGRGRSITFLVAKNVVYLIHKPRTNSELTHTHSKNSTRLDRTLPSCHVTTLLVPGLHIPSPKFLNKQENKRQREKKVNVSALKLKTVHEGGNESISKNAVGGFYSSLGIA